MEPDSIALLVALLAAAGALVWAAARLRRLFLRLLSGVLALALAMLGGMAAVNQYFGYYQTWTQLAADVSGNYAAFTASAASTRRDAPALHGRLQTITIAGARSGITRSALVYLPPQYFQPHYRHTRFPVVELVHGTPGSPSSWLVHLDIVRLANKLLSTHQMGPMVLVMPTMSTGRNFQECVNAPGGAQDDTYITRDVRTAIQSRYRVSRDPAQWGIAGYSSGGYCAANLALRHPGAFGAAGIMDGYFRPQDGPAAAALHFAPGPEARNNPIALAQALPTGASPLPAFWVAAGTANAADWSGAKAFSRALHGVEQVPLYREPGAGHNFYAWQPALPHLLTWMWRQLAPPDLRVRFPQAGGVREAVLPAHRPGAVTGPRPARPPVTPATNQPVNPPVNQAANQPAKLR